MTLEEKVLVWTALAKGRVRSMLDARAFSAHVELELAVMVERARINRQHGQLQRFQRERQQRGVPHA